MKNENTWKLNHLKEIWQKEARQETAKQIFAELDGLNIPFHTLHDEVVFRIPRKDYEKLKSKYEVRE